MEFSTPIGEKEHNTLVVLSDVDLMPDRRGVQRPSKPAGHGQYIHDDTKGLEVSPGGLCQDHLV